MSTGSVSCSGNIRGGTYLVITDNELDDGIVDAVLGEGGGVVVREHNGIEGRLTLEIGGLRGLLLELGLLPLGDRFFLFRDVVLLTVLAVRGIMRGGNVAAKARGPSAEPARFLPACFN